MSRIDAFLRRPATGLLAPALIFYAVVLAVPFIGLIAVGFLTTSQTGLFDTVPTLANYRRVLTDGYYLGVLWTTLRISLEVTAWCLVFGYPTAYWLATASRRTR